MPISAVVGRADIMRLMEDIFYSGTFGGETLSLAAAIATIDKIEREKVTERLWATGGELMEQARARIAAAGLSDVVGLVGRRALGDPHLQGSREGLQGGDQDIVPARDDRRRRAHQRKPQCLLCPQRRRMSAACWRPMITRFRYCARRSIAATSNVVLATRSFVRSFRCALRPDGNAAEIVLMKMNCCGPHLAGACRGEI